MIGFALAAANHQIMVYGIENNGINATVVSEPSGTTPMLYRLGFHHE